MGSSRVKLKFGDRLSVGLVLGAVMSLTASLAGLIPSGFVETVYARGIYPYLSSALTFAAGRLGVSSIDLLLPTVAVGALYLVYRRKFLRLLGLISAGYLIFFWTWGLNYHRAPLVAKLDFSAARVNESSVAALALETAQRLNALYPARLDAVYEPGYVAAGADRRMRQTVARLDGTPWSVSSRLKTSRILNPFFRAAGVDGMFNPFGHEPLVTTGVLGFELPMIVLHEMAHVRGYPNEGDANFMALMAAVNSSDVGFRYSGWLTLWLYLRSPERDALLDAGVRADVQAIYDRIARNRIDWVSRAQTRSLDVFLKAHDVPEGVRSYAEIVNLAVGTRPSWDRFAEEE